MGSARDHFKYALRQSKLDGRLILSNKLVNHMQRHDYDYDYEMVLLRHTIVQCIME